MTLSQLFYSSRIRLKTRCIKEEVTKKGARPQKEVTLHATSQSSPCTPGSRQYVGLDKVADECGKQSRKVYTFNEDEVVGLIKQWRMDEADNNSDTEDEEEEKPDASASSSKSSLKRDNVLTEEVVDIINKLRTDEKFKFANDRTRWLIGTNGVFKKRYYGNAKSGNALLSSEDEQFEDALTNPKISAVSTIPRSKEEHENFHNLNSEFSERMGKFSNNSAERVQLLTRFMIFAFGNGRRICADEWRIFGRLSDTFSSRAELKFGRNGICERPAFQDTPIIKTSFVDFDAIRPPRFIFKSDYNFTIITCLENHINYKSDITHPDETYGPSQLYLGFYQPSPGVFFYEYNEPDEMIDLIIMVLVVNDDNYTPDQPLLYEKRYYESTTPEAIE
ncbi:hypothetical protein GLOIN_2v1776888 [Rhizophagus irregularis DAOM 181602=DAOM 197198]|nr:hypothetical protein GLOIN_2v1776888 [Rhizophagus irregularis DAOM 181602=DAOM 197198]